MKKTVWLLAALLLLFACTGLAQEERRIVVIRRAPAVTYSLRGQTAPENTVMVVDVPEGAELDAYLADVRAQDGVLAADEDVLIPLAALPSDPAVRSGEAWQFERIGQEQTWNSVRNSTPVLIAMIDTGLDASHPELALRTVEGYDYVRGVNGTMDVSGHGTFVAGCAVAACDNGRGLAGAAGSANVRVMPLRCGGEYAGDPNLRLSCIVQALYDAAAMRKGGKAGLKIVNMSFATVRDLPTLRAAVGEALGTGLLLVAAAGNEGGDAPMYPASYDGVLSVAATDRSDSHASFSQYNAQVDIAAPGERVYSLALGGGYRTDSGTSYSCAMTSGALAVLLANDSTLSNHQAVNALMTTAADLNGFGRDVFYGAGRLNLAKALSYAHGTTTLTIVCNASGAGADEPFTFLLTLGAAGEYPVSGDAAGTISNGGTLTLRAGQRAVISGLPAGAAYVVRESEANLNGFATTATGDRAYLSSGDTAVFTNVRALPPLTGDRFPAEALAALLLLSALALTRCLRRRAARA